MNNYCGTCQNYVENDPCDVCEGTENNHVYYVPDFRKRKNSPMKHGAGEHKTDDFIRRAEAINEMHNILVSPIESDDEFNIGVRRCMSSVNNIPAANVVEVRHGRWERVDYGNGLYNYHCSSCRHIPRENIRSNYCPNCGADMRGGVNDV